MSAQLEASELRATSAGAAVPGNALLGVIMNDPTG
jgi:hypothetical protein